MKRLYEWLRRKRAIRKLNRACIRRCYELMDMGFTEERAQRIVIATLDRFLVSIDHAPLMGDDE